MSIIEVALGFGGLLLAAFSFLFGRMFSQSEAVLADKRRVYEEFLVACPGPNEACKDWTPEREIERADTFQAFYGKLCLYAAPPVMQAVNRYLVLLDEADKLLSPNSEALHPAFQEAAKAHNDIILEMRRDALGWSMFGYSGKTRLPKDG
ncbi:hypothetical protein [Leisingera sp. F5]|uniref:hypothetical protein n=1 Tax=Leisingera sp. F5 TaxID=1813816 RepID=UPI0025BEF59D|nr:hypothetical protein [Leisingera sp. F5]